MSKFCQVFHTGSFWKKFLATCVFCSDQVKIPLELIKFCWHFSFFSFQFTWRQRLWVLITGTIRLSFQMAFYQVSFCFWLIVQIFQCTTTAKLQMKISAKICENDIVMTAEIVFCVALTFTNSLYIVYEMIKLAQWSTVQIYSWYVVALAIYSTFRSYSYSHNSSR